MAGAGRGFLYDRVVGARGQCRGRGGAARHRHGLSSLSVERLPIPARAPVAGADADLGHAAELRRVGRGPDIGRSEEHTSELQSLMRISYAVFCLKKKKK